MRRGMLLALALALVLWALPAWAEEPAEYAGKWSCRLALTEGAALLDAGTFTIAADGGWVVDGANALPEDDDAASYTAVQDDFGQLILRKESAEGRIVELYVLSMEVLKLPFEPSDAPSFTAGMWEISHVAYTVIRDAVPFILDMRFLDAEPRPLSLSSIDDLGAVQKQLAPAVAGTLLEQLITDARPVTSMELISDDVLMLKLRVTRSNSLAVYLTPASTIPTDLLAGRWLPDGMSVGGIPVAPEAIDADDTVLAFDEAGNAQLGDRAMSLTLADGALLLDGMPLTIDDGGLTLEAAEGVAVHFVTEADWYRAQLNGQWQLDWIDIPGLYAATVSGDEGVNTLLVIGADGTAVLRHDTGEMNFTVQATDDMTEYRLLGEDGDERLLSIVSLDERRIAITGGSGAYTWYFVSAE